MDGFDRELHNYTYSKMVLIHALGNTGSSRDHLLTYMQPGEGDNSWRRAAILAMRHFKCVEVYSNLLQKIVKKINLCLTTTFTGCLQLRIVNLAMIGSDDTRTSNKD